jgi:two-component system response regulator DesR
MERIRVLLVDDNRAFLDAAGHLLAEDPMLDVVEMILSPKRALSLISVLRPDVVILELEMPEMSGLLAALHLKAMPAGPKVVIVSDYDAPMYQALAVSVHADAFLFKRSFADRAVATIKELFSNRTAGSSEPGLSGAEPVAR